MKMRCLGVFASMEKMLPIFFTFHVQLYKIITDFSLGSFIFPPLLMYDEYVWKW